MKRYILSLLSLVVLAACSSYDESFEKPIDEPTDNDNNIAEKVIVSAYINGSDDTRVAMSLGENAGEPVVKVNWDESGESFWVYSNQMLYQDRNNAVPKEFTQVAGKRNEFEGTAPLGSRFYAFYNCLLSGGASGDHTFQLSYDLSQQDGTGDKILMMSESETISNSGTLDFDHLGFVLKPTFKFRGAGEATPRDMDALITKIEMENVQYVNTVDGLSTSQTITITPSELDDIFIFLPKLRIYPFATESGSNYSYGVQYEAGHTFTFKVTTNDGKEYTAKPLTLPASPTLEAGKFYTATIELAETRCYLPKGTVFKQQLVDCIKNYKQEHPDYRVYRIVFEANSHKKGTELKGSDDSPVSGSPAYFVVDDNNIEIHSAAKTFVFNSDCSKMFSVDNDYYQPLQEISFAYFTNCDTSLATNMSQMFSYCYKLFSFYDFNFDTSKVTNMYRMFYYCGNGDNITATEPGSYLNLSSFNTQNVTNMEEMFYAYRGSSLDISNFDMSNVGTVRKMFSFATHLGDLKLGKFAIPENCDLTDMFFEVGSLYRTYDLNDKAKIYVGDDDILNRLQDATNTGLDSKYAELVKQ